MAPPHPRRFGSHGILTAQEVAQLARHPSPFRHLPSLTLTLYRQNVRGFSPLQTRLVFAMVAAGTVVGGLVAPRVIARIGATRAIVVGLVVQAAATLPLAFLDQLSGSLVDVLIGTFIG
ncbi:hypothetical protein [Microbacterium sp. B19]|uniref:hypothetical protein n=1 Tax=Microbacterium sp. B19 TaxID=96765 RepID=UPI0003B5AAE2|nr:hypothetical protein [Microbacterium sp. B19]